MTVRILAVKNAYISPSPTQSASKYMHAAANIISANNPFSPAIELREGRIVLEAVAKVLFAVTGNAHVEINGKKAEPWRSYTLTPGSRVTVEGNSYISLHGLQAYGVSTKLPLSPGFTLSCTTVNGEFTAKKLLAFKVPVTMRLDTGNWREMIRRLQRHVALAREAVEKGAELVRVRVGGREFELWVQELA